jgi:hypothetical protein
MSIEGFFRRQINKLPVMLLLILMKGLYRVAIYVLATAIVEGILIWGLITYAESNRLTIWFVLAENFGMVLFLPYQGIRSPSTGVFALLTGIVCWFFIVAGIGETINWLRKRR